MTRTNGYLSAYRLMSLFRLLVKTPRITVSEILAHWESDPVFQHRVSYETLDTYLSTLRRLGCTIARFNETLMLQAQPIQMELSTTETHLLQQVAERTAPFNRVEQGNGFQRWLQLMAGVAPVFSSAPRTVDSSETALDEALLNACRSRFQVQLTLSKGQSVTVEPLKLIRDAAIPALRVCDRSDVPYQIPLTDICAITPLASHKRMLPPTCLVTLELTGDMVRNYRLYPDECLLEQTTTRLRVVNRCDDVTALCYRLIKYGTQCRINSPTAARQAMHHILATLSGNSAIAAELP
jgi:hypothetical protein